MSLDSLALLFATMFVVSAVPGPSDAAVAARASAYGARHAIAMIAGILVADAVFIVVALLGLGTLARALSEWFVVVTLGCGLYLVYLGWTMLRADAAQRAARELPSSSMAASLAGGMTVTFADPKAIFFYMGLLPAFIDMHRASWWHGVIVMSVATIVIGIVKGVYAWLAIALRRRLEKPDSAGSSRAGGAFIQRAGGAVLVAAGVYLIVEPVLR